MDKELLTYSGRPDNEEIHEKADDILLEFIDPEIKKAYEELQNRVKGFWYS